MCVFVARLAGALPTLQSKRGLDKTPIGCADTTRRDSQGSAAMTCRISLDGCAIKRTSRLLPSARTPRACLGNNKLNHKETFAILATLRVRAQTH